MLHGANIWCSCHELSQTCPSCRLPCGQPLKCGHSCVILCHDKRPPAPAPLTKTQKKKKIVPELPAPIPTPCPPCTVPVMVPCVGGHGVHERPCHDRALRPCDKLCNRPLPCSRHHCKAACHAVGDEALTWEEIDKQGICAPVCGECDQPCALPRPAGCTHPCSQKCHDGDCPPCEELVKEMCHCGALQINTPCCERLVCSDEEALLCCQNKCNKKLACGHKCILICHSGDCMEPSKCRKKVTLHCPCKLVKEVHSAEKCVELIGHQSFECGVLQGKRDYKVKCTDACAVSQVPCALQLKPQ